MEENYNKLREFYVKISKQYVLSKIVVNICYRIVR